MSTTTTDRIEKKILLRAPRARVWRALTDAREFGAWFGVELEGPFEPGALVRGKIAHQGRQLILEVTIDRIEPVRLFSYRWHPYAIDPGVDYSSEPMTLVVFELGEVAEGTMLTVTETGFDRIPLARRAEAFRMNEGGWEAQIRNLEKHVAKG